MRDGLPRKGTQSLTEKAMEKCDVCQNESDDLDFLKRCEPCFRAYINSPDNLKPNTFKAMIRLKGGQELSSAHYKDILSREAQPDGQVKRKTGRLYI